MSNLQDPRVFFALERTLLAWNRSSLGLIAFGFVIEKSTLLGQIVNPMLFAHKVTYYKWLGIIIIFFGMVISIWSILQNRIGLRSLSESELIAGYRTHQPMVLSLFNTFVGMLLIISFWI